MDVRIAPAVGPYSEHVREDLAKVMPPGMQPLSLFRMLAKNPRVLRRIRRSGLLDSGSISLRQREVIILRTTALNGAEYEWGVHVMFFAAAAQLDAAAQLASVHLDAGAPCWTPDEALLVRACDELHFSGTLSHSLFAELRGCFEEAQLLELLVLAGFYRTISYLVRATGLALERDAPRFPARPSEDSADVEQQGSCLCGAVRSRLPWRDQDAQDLSAARGSGDPRTDDSASPAAWLKRE